jgi:hypothetical protein
MIEFKKVVELFVENQLHAGKLLKDDFLIICSTIKSSIT